MATPGMEIDRPDIVDEAPLDLLITDDFIKRLEIAADLYQRRYLPLAIKLTNEGDWVKHGERYSLQASGAEKLANPFGIVWDRPIVTKHEREDAEGRFYEYEVEGILKAGALKRWGWFTGNCSSRDQFFSARGAKVEEGDIRKAAFSNWLVNGIARLIGIRNPTPEMLASAGLKLDRITKPDYSGGQRTAEGGGDKISEAQRKRLWAICKDKGVSEEALRNYIEEKHGFKSTGDVTRKTYEAICAWADKGGPKEPAGEAAA